MGSSVRNAKTLQNFRRLMSRADDGDNPQFDHAPSETNRHTRKAALISGLGKIPDSYQRQNRCKNHEQTNRSPLCFWILHILLLEVGGRERVDRPENACACVRSRHLPIVRPCSVRYLSALSTLREIASSDS
jgi:hypothetical protein